ncbi:hypothetical protein MKW98_019229 [Papaver atlanticum]|uniref:Uncharacterized protein n=1 Tax=Papaver atlanticum TaxID=357466 RepID=A0AAD4XV26_9MAGN|nr:hypothetical protein MKW98_019229 [Papaver atlanticum]
MTRIRISRNWNVLDFMGTNDVTSLGVFMLDDNRDELHGVVPKKLIWKFDPLLLEIPHHKFTFSKYEDLEWRLANTYLTDVMGVLICLTNLQEMKRADGIKGTPVVIVVSSIIFGNIRDDNPVVALDGSGGYPVITESRDGND